MEQVKRWDSSDNFGTRMKEETRKILTLIDGDQLFQFYLKISQPAHGFHFSRYHIFFYAITKQNPILRFNSCLGLLGINTNNLVKFTMGKHFYWLFILINSVVEMNIQEKVQKLIYGVKNHRKHKYISWTLLCLDTSLWFCYHSNGHIQLFGKRINNESI